MQLLKNKTLIGALAVAFAASLWGVDGVYLTPNLYSLPVPYVVLIFHFLPFVIMNIFLHKEYKQLKRFDKGDLVVIFFIALLGGSLGTLSIVKALFLVNFQKLSAIVLLQKLQPVFAIVVARIVLGEKVSKKFFGWALLALSGSYFLTFGLKAPVFDSGNNMLLASFYSLFAAFSFGSSTALGRKIVNKYDFKTVSFFRYGFTSLIMLVINLFFTGSLLTNLVNTTPVHWKFFGIIALTTGSLALFIYYFGLSRIKAQVATFCELMFPLTTLILDYSLHKTVLSTVQWIAVGILLLSVIRISLLGKVRTSRS